MARKPTQPDHLPTIFLAGRIEQNILLIRGQRVIIDDDLAVLYGVTTKRLNEQVKRNADRFPKDFVFQLTGAETDAILRSQNATSSDSSHSRSQNATLKPDHGGRRYRPYAFTEHGALMAANVLKSSRAAKVSVYVVRAFVKLRELLSTHRELSAKLTELETKLQDHDEQIIALINAIRSLMEEPEAPPKPPIGFQTETAKRRK